MDEDHQSKRKGKRQKREEKKALKQKMEKTAWYRKRLMAGDEELGWGTRKQPSDENAASTTSDVNGERRPVAGRKDQRLYEDWVDDELDDYDEAMFLKMHWKDK